MEPLFTNKCIYTKDVFRESQLNYNKRQKAISIVINCLLVLIMIIETVIHPDTEIIFLALFLTVMSVLFYFVVPVLAAGLSYKRSLELYHEELVSTSEFFDDHFVSTSRPSNAVITIRYDQFKRIVATKQLYLLIVRFHLFYAIDKNGFDKINMLEFEKFLRDKAPKAKFHL